MNLLKISEAAKLLGVSKDTLRRWEASGKINSIRTPSGYRVYDLQEIERVKNPPLPSTPTLTLPLSYGEGTWENLLPSNGEGKNGTTSYSGREQFDSFPLSEEEGTESTSFPLFKGEGQDGGANSGLWKSIFIASSLPIILGALTLAFFLLAPQKAQSLVASLPEPVSKLLSFTQTSHPHPGEAPVELRVDPSREKELTKAPSPLAGEGRGEGGNPRESLKVLAESTEGYILEINSNTNINGLLTATKISGEALLNSILPGENISLTQGSNGNLTLSAVLPANLVNTVQGETGDVNFTAGTDISISALSISNTSTLSTVRGRGGCSTCIVSDDIKTLVATKLTGTIDSARLSGSYTGITTVGTLSELATGATTISSTLAVTGATTLSSTLAVTGATTLSSYMQLAQITAPSTTTNRLYNVSGDLVWNGTNLSAGGALPVGTTGQTMYNSSGTWTASSNLYHNGTNVGIGTTSPAQALDVVGDINASAKYRIGNSIILHNTGTNNTFLGVSAGNTTLTGAANTFIGTSSGNSITSGNNNTAVGYLSLNANTSGSQNTAFGYSALFSNTTATDNSAFGWDALYNNTTGIDNNAFGRQALYTNTTGNANSAMGRFALLSNTTGSNNVAFGNAALNSNTTASNLTAVGYQALYSNTTGTANTALGYQSLQANTTGHSNTALGYQALTANTTGYVNTAIGVSALQNNTSGVNNTAVGWNSLTSNTTGLQNTAVGAWALYTNSTGRWNSAFGDSALYVNTTGQNNTALGSGALGANTTGNNNIAIGYAAGNNLTTGSNNIILGYDIDATSATNTNTLNIGNLIFGTGLDGTGTTLSSGNIGIGTTAPGYKLEVAGTLRASGLVTASGGLTLTGTTNINTSGTSATSIGNTSAALTLASTATTLSTTDSSNAPSIDTGDGADGALTVDEKATFDINSNTNGNGGRTAADAVNFVSTVSTSAGATSITVSTTPTGLAVGDEILIINLKGTSSDYSNVGKYETKTITSISSNTLSFATGLTNAYDGTTQKIMVQRVPNYTNVTVKANGTLTTGAWSSSTGKGGVLFFRATGEVKVDSTGTIDVSGKGYKGGNLRAGGETYNGTGGNGGANISNGTSGQGGGGGGGGGGSTTGGAGTVGGAGGGGGHNTGPSGGGGYGTAGTANGGGANGSGTSGGNGDNNSGSLGEGGGGGGGTYGSANLNQIYFGSGAGAPAEGAGGSGGGIIVIASNKNIVNGSISSNGKVGKTGSYTGSGGGAGGSVYLLARNLELGSSLVTASGASGTAGSFGTGGNGGNGRIRLDYGTLSGTTSPSAGYELKTSSSLAINKTDTGKVLSLQSSGTERLFVDDQGKLGLTSTATTGNTLSVTNNSINSSSLFYGAAATANTNFNLIQLQSGSTLADKYTVDYAGNVTQAGDLTVTGGDITLDQADNTSTLKASALELSTGEANLNYGTGADGACTVSSTITLDAASSNTCVSRANADAVNFTSTVSTAAGATSITVSSTPTGLAVGDEILIINLKGTATDNVNVGKYETRVITAIDTNTLSFTKALVNTYDGTTQKIMVQRIPQYTNVTVSSGGTLTITAFNGTKNGVLFFRATGTVTVNSGGTVSVAGKGYAGGTSSGSCSGGTGGETYNGAGGTGGTGCAGSLGTSGQGGGGGSSSSSDLSIAYGTVGGGGGGASYGWSGGGGGAHATVGTGGSGSSNAGSSGSGSTGGNGGAGLACCTSVGGGGGGGSYGSADLSKIFFGSGGGGGSAQSGASVSGGTGGGILVVSAKEITNSGSVSADASAAGSGGAQGGAGGGAGGSVYLLANSLTVGSSLVTASGSAGGSGSGGTGGAGGTGRVRLDYATLSGTTSPTAGYTYSVKPQFAVNQLGIGDILALQTNGTNRFAVDALGNLTASSLGLSGTNYSFTGNSNTTGNILSVAGNSLTTGNVLSLSSTSTAGGASGASYLLNLSRSGTNSNASHTAYGLYSTVTNTGTTSTNIAGYFSASGATTNYGVYSAAGTNYFNGNVGIGTTAPSAKLDVSGNVNIAGTTTLTGTTNINTTGSSATSIGNTSAALTLASTATTLSTTDSSNAPSIDTGDGADGALTVDEKATFDINSNTNGNGGRTAADAVNFVSTVSTSAGATSITVSATPTGLAVGDEILIINLKGTSSDYSNVGKYETKTITAISVNTLSFATGLTNAYDGTTQKIMVQRVPNYTNVTVKANGTITTGAWSSSTGKGGVLYFRATGEVKVDSSGTIDVSGKGYAGGAPVGINTAGLGGETYNGTGGNGAKTASCNGTNNATSGQGGGGGGLTSGGSAATGATGGAGGGASCSTTGGGGGGGYASVGTGGATGGASGSGTTGGDGSSSGGAGGGGSYGSANLSQIYFGSGGGSGGGWNSGGGRGGKGGGILIVGASRVSILGTVNVNGTNGGNGVQNDGGAGGAGAGGSAYISANSMALGSSLVTASAGTAGTTTGGASNGGAGGNGRIRLDYATLSGTTSPSAGYELKTSSSLAINKTDTGKVLSLQSSGTERLFVDDQGKLGLTSTATTGNTLSVTNNSINSSSLFYGAAATANTNFNLIQLQSGSTLADKYTVDYAGNVTQAGDLTVTGGDITLDQADNTSTLKASALELSTGEANLNYGTGADGACTVSSTITLDAASSNTCVSRANADAVNFTSTVSTAAGATSITVSSTPTGLAVGDEILIINLKGTASNNVNVGKYETRVITAIDTNTLSFTKALANTYDGTTQKIMVQRIPNYTNVTVSSSGTMTISAWSSSTGKGGVLFFRSTGTVTVASGGTITVASKGYIGGTTAGGNAGGIGGETYNGTGGTGANWAVNTATSGQGGGGGGSTSNSEIPVGTVGGAGGGGGSSQTGGGGGGGHAAIGTGGTSGGANGSGASGGNGGSYGGGGGGTYGSSDLAKLFMGSGGGSGGGYNCCSGVGGAGGGILVASVKSITVSGTISGNGGTGGNGIQNDASAGGGGAGGSIYLLADSLTVGSSLVTASAGSGGTTTGGASNGGAGGNGRIRLDYATLSGTTSPTAGYTYSVKAQFAINQYGIGDILALQTNGTNRFAVDALGNLTASSLGLSGTNYGFTANSNTSGTILSVTGASTTTATLLNVLQGSNSAFKVAGTASAVNGVTVTPATTGNDPTIAASGSDTNVDLSVTGKGTGDVNVTNLIANGYKLVNDFAGGVTSFLAQFNGSQYASRGQSTASVFAGALTYITGKINQAVPIEGLSSASGSSNVLTFSRGTQVSGNRYETLDGNQGSVSFWYKPNYNYNTDVNKTLFEFPSLLRLIYNASTDTFDFGYYNGTNFTTVKVSSASQTFSANTWIYLAVTWDTDNSPYLQIKVNDAAIAQYTSGSITAREPQATNYIGADSSSQNGAQGAFDDFIITDHVLRQIEGGTVTTSSTTVTGTSTTFLKLSQLGYQDKFKLADDATIYTINAIASDTSLTLTSAPSTHASATAFKAGQMVALYNAGNGSAATLIEAYHRLFYATMDGSGSLSTTNSSFATSNDWKAYDGSTNTNGQIALNGLMEAASSGTPTSWSSSGTPTALADAETANIFSDTRAQKISVDAASEGITLTSNISVTAGQRYRVAAYVKSDGTNRSNLRIRNVTASSDLATMGTTSSQWQLLQTDITIPSGMSNLNLFLESGTAATYSFYIDNVAIWRLP